MAELQPIIAFHSRHFVRHLGICNRICVNLLQLMFDVITHNSVKKRSLRINKWLNYATLAVLVGEQLLRNSIDDVAPSFSAFCWISPGWRTI